MKLSRLFASALVTSAMAACGGSGTGSVADPSYQSAAPSYQRFSIAQSDADAVQPTESAQVSTSQNMQADCHPHLFQRSHEIVSRVNRHFAKLLRHIEDTVKDNPSLKSGNTHVWENVKDGIDRRFTMTGATNADGSATFTYLLEMEATSAAKFVTVFSGTITTRGSAGVDGGAAASAEEKGSVTFDFTALSTVITSEKARGQITDAIDQLKDPVKGINRTAALTLTNFLPEEGDTHGARNGSYIWEREPELGGSFAFQDTLVLLCTSNPNALTSDLNLVARWYKASDATVHGRTDAEATGGQLPTGNVWVGATCASGATSSTPAEGYWLIKQEDAGGLTVSGTAHANGATPCDAVLGAVPSLANNATDFSFAGISFTTPYPFPNQW